jgi:PAS domain S-box-containing protein
MAVKETDEHKSRFEALISAIPDIIMEVDTEKTYTWANKAGYDFFGEDVIGKSADHYFEGEQDTYTKVGPVFEGTESTVYVESWQRRIDGKHRLLAWWCRTLKGADGTVTGSLSTARDITEAKQTELSLQESEKKWRKLVITLPEYIALHDAEGRYLFLNHFAKGFSEKDIIGKSLFEILPDESREVYRQSFNSCLQSAKTVQFEYDAPGDGGEIRTYEGCLVPMVDQSEVTMLISIARDITINKFANNQIINALKAKEVLLREINHRVKNNLQMVSSLLNLKAQKTSDASIRDILWESRNRIYSIALVHDKLYQSGNLDEISMKDYTSDLVSELCRVYVTDPGKIRFRLEIDDVKFMLSYAIPCGLILNEIISNCLKHAFPASMPVCEKPLFFISIKQMPDKCIQISAGDNGIGLPAGYKVSDSSSLGLYLIHIIARDQLNGTIEINQDHGTVYTITFNPFAG